MCFKHSVYLSCAILMLACTIGCENMDLHRPTIIDHVAANTSTYVGSPSIAVLGGGTIIASHDIFGPKSTLDRTVIFASSDGGHTWQKRSEIVGQFWSSLFIHNNALYVIGLGHEFGPVVIRRSDDSGHTWTIPRDETHGLILDGHFHTAPTPVVEHDGRIWRAMEDIGGPGGWPTHFRCFMLSVPANADLLRANQWQRSNVLEGNPNWLDGHFHGWLEGNAVVGPDGSMLDVLRVDAKPVGDQAATVKVSGDGRTSSFDPVQDFITMPGGSVKFTLRRDPVGGLYWAISDILPKRVPTTNPGIVRNTLALVSSRDLKTWAVQAVLWHNPDVSKHGWQYVDWQFDGDDLVAVARVADDDRQGGAHDFHDANMLVFFRIKAFRSVKAEIDKPYLLPLAAMTTRDHL